MGKQSKPFMTGIRFPSSVYTNIVKKVWGQELWFTNRPWFCSKLLIIKPGFQSSLHVHAEKIEEFICLDGGVKLETPTGDLDMKAGDRYLLMSGMEHRFSSQTGGIILEISTEHSDSDVTRLAESGRIDEGNKQGIEGSVSESEPSVL